MCGCKTNKIQRVIDKAQKPKVKPKLDEKNIFVSKPKKNSKKKLGKKFKKRKKY